MPEVRYRKGLRVRFKLGTRFVEGEILEDRGPIGVGGRHLYLVEFRAGLQPGESSQVELPAEDLQALRGAARE